MSSTVSPLEDILLQVAHHWLLIITYSYINCAGDKYENGVGKAAGWGTLYEGGQASCHLRQVDVPIIANEECVKTNYTGSLVTEDMICAGQEMGGKDSCQGDSGGPLMRLMDNKRLEIIGMYKYNIYII